MAAINEKTRLNASIRDAILENAIEQSGVKAESIAIIEARAAFCEKVVQFELDRIGETQATLRAKHKKAESVGNTFIYVSTSKQSANPGGHSYVNANICGMRIYLYANGALNGGTATHMTEETHPHLRYISDGGNFYPRQTVTIADTAYADEWNAICKRHEANNAKREELKAAVTAALKKYTTVGRLLEAWPEVKDLMPKEYTVSTGTGLALSTETLNAICGLPK